jgi:hypothetical protein
MDQNQCDRLAYLINTGKYHEAVALATILASQGTKVKVSQAQAKFIKSSRSYGQ